MYSDDLQVESETFELGVIVTPKGDIDLSRSPTFRESLHKAQIGRPKRLVVDLSHVDYMDSSGVATLVEALQMTRKSGSEVVLCSLGDKVRSIFEIARLDAVFKIVADRQDAMDA